MSIDSASGYAQAIAAGIQERADSGCMFGVEHTESGEHFETIADGLDGVADSVDDDFSELSAGDYLSDVLDIQYLVSSGREYISARVCIALGGPTAWINTHTREIECNWWSSVHREPLPASFCAALDDYLEDVFSC